MTHPNNFINQTIHNVSLRNRVLIGGGIGLVVVSFFLIQTNSADPAWGKLWMIRPLIVLPLAGMGAGLINYFLSDLRSQGSIGKTLAIVATVIVYFIALWMGVVVGFDGTLWD